MHSHMDIQRATLRKWFAADLREMRRQGRRKEAREAVAKAHEIAKLAEIEAREKAATPGPWDYNGYSSICSEPVAAASTGDEDDHVCQVAFVPASHGDTATGIQVHDAVFIAAARSDVPTLIAALRASRTRETRYEAALKRIATFESQHSPGDEAQIARAALGEEAPHA